MAKLVSAKEVANDYNIMTRNDFPGGFVFGTGTSAYQVEGATTFGGRAGSVWDDFSMRAPYRISDGANGNRAVDLYNRYTDDIKIMKSMGFDAYRFSISWSRIIPSGKICHGINRGGIDYYNNLINTVLTQGMVPYVTLFHWDLPDSLEKEYGGFLKGDIVNDYRDYVYVCFWEFGDRVKHWTTFNEPWTYCYHGYVSRTMPPGENFVYVRTDAASDVVSSSATMTSVAKGSSDDSPKPLHYYRIHEYIPPPTVTIPITPITTTVLSDEPKSYRAPIKISNQDYEPFIAAKNMIVAHAIAVDLYKTKFQAQQGGDIGMVLNNNCFEPLDDAKQGDIDAARRVHDFMMGWFLEPILTGKYPETMRPYIPIDAKFTDDEIKLLTKNKIDFLGVNYYTARYVQDYPDADKDPKLYPFDQFQKAKVLTKDKYGNDIGPCPGASWLYIVPWGIKKLLNKINDYYNNSTYNIPALYITENGVAEIADPKKTAAVVARDAIRVNYYRDHLGNLLDVIKEWKTNTIGKRLDIKGFFLWSWVDNFEWTSGYSLRFGIVYIDYMNTLKRYPKNSAVWFSQFLAGKIPQLPPEENAI